MAVYRPKNRKFYTIEFVHDGKRIQKRTKATNLKKAIAIEAAIRTEIERGNYGILRPKPKPTLAVFLKDDFLPFVEANQSTKPSSARYYRDGVKRLQASNLAALKLDEINGQHVAYFADKNGHLSASTVNCAIRTLRRALNLAVEWGKLDKMPKITLVRGERQRDFVLNRIEAERYLNACPQPWKDCATLILCSGVRPGEAYRLRWENVALNGHGGLIQITEGKTKAARRMLPIIPKLYEALKARHESQGKPESGWVFPSGSASGHLEESSAKKYHAKALATLAKAHKDDPKANPEIKPFEPYCLRHTALTWIAESGCDAYTLARIAGHSSIQITMRYCHPQAEAVQAAFQRLTAGPEVPTNFPTSHPALPVGKPDMSATNSK